MFLLYKSNYLLTGNLLQTTCTGHDEVLPVLTEATCHEDVREAKVQLHAFLKSALDGDELYNKLKLRPSLVSYIDAFR
jgi:hypothetical protein